MSASIFCLNVHASWRCRHSGACCSSGWAIPVEAPLHRRLRTASAGAFAPGIESRDDLPAGFTGILRTRDDGSCVFFDRGSRLCDIHRRKGHDWLPASCQQFPRVSLLDPRGTFVTLSHYCPSAADLLFADDGSTIDVVVNPAAFPGDAEYDGLDARDAFPPFLLPGVLMDWETLAAWDRFTFDRLSRETVSVDAAMRDLRRACDHLRAWTPSDGPLARRLETLPQMGPQMGPKTASQTGTTAPLPASDEEEAFIRPLCRYAAAKFFGSWVWYQGAGLRTVIRSVEAALAEVRAQARQARQHGRMLDRTILRESIRQADLRLVHLASREALAREWSKAEDEDHLMSDHKTAANTNQSDADLKSKLTPEQYHVTQEKGTERAFTGKYWDTKTAGTYKCVVCGEELFSSDTKYDSGSGWPSFYQPADKAKVDEHTDRSYGMTRTEVTCHKCGAHLGHVFPDGPRPTGLRYCINSASLDLDEKKAGE